MAETAPVKRGRGRPKTDHSVPIYNIEAPTKRAKLEVMYDQWYGCTRCDLSKFRPNGNKDIVFGEGNADADILVIGEAPGEEEEASSVPFVGPSGKMLNKIIAQACGDPELLQMGNELARSHTNANLSRFHNAVEEWRHQNMFIINVVACRPPENATPPPSSINACWERVWNTVLTVDPLFIFAVGKTAIMSLMKKQVEITKVRGDVTDVTHEGHLGKVSYPAMAVFHPSYLLRKADWRQGDGDWQKTIEDWRQGFKVVNFLQQRHY